MSLYLWEERFLLQNGQQSHWLLHKLNGRLQIHSKVDHLPLNSLPHVLLLLQHKHVVVEELLKLLITEVDADLLKRVELKDLKAGNIQHSNEVDLDKEA